MHVCMCVRDCTCLLVCACVRVCVCASIQCGGLRPEEDIGPNVVHMAWQIPQYFLMTMGEVVFSVTGLEFSYSQVDTVTRS